MREDILPAALLCAMLGLLLGRVSWRTAALAGLALAATAGAVSPFAVPLEWRGAVVIGGWIETMLLAIGVYRAGPVGRWPAIIAALAAGLFVGATTSLAGRAGILVEALPWVLVWIPSGWLIARGWTIAVKVLASWLLAVALLSAGVVLVQPKAGGDHLD